MSETLKAISDPVRRDILDLLKDEKKSAGELADRDDIIYTPHTAFYTETAVKNLVEGALNAAVDVITTGDSPNIVNR